METKEIKVNIPEGYEIDKENSTFECIKFKPIAKRFRDDIDAYHVGYHITPNGRIMSNMFYVNTNSGWSYATEKQARSALAMAKISQIMAHDERFGGPVTDEDWCDDNQDYYTIIRWNNELLMHKGGYSFLAFHTEKQANLFLKENEDLIKDYLMID